MITDALELQRRCVDGSAIILPMGREQMVRSLWESLSQGDPNALEVALAPDARWRAVEDGPWNCNDRATIIQVLGQRLQDGLVGQIEEVLELQERTVVAFRPETPRTDGWPLHDGIRYLVLSFRGELIVEMKGCLDRTAALAYARTGG